MEISEASKRMEVILGDKTLSSEECSIKIKELINEYEMSIK